MPWNTCPSLSRVANEDCLLGHKPDSKSRQLHLADLKPSGTAMRVLKTASGTGFILENDPDAMWHFHRVLNVYPNTPDEQSTPVSQRGHVNRQVKRTSSLCWLLTAGDTAWQCYDISNIPHGSATTYQTFPMPANGLRGFSCFAYSLTGDRYAYNLAREIRIHRRINGRWETRWQMWSFS